MISNPKYGYCNIKMGDYEDLCDTTDLPLNIARAFISYYESGSGYSYIKNDTYFILENDKVYILKEIKENKERQLIERQLIKNVSVDTLAYEFQEDILKCPEAWVREFMVSDFSEDLKTLRNMDEIDRKKRLIWILNDEEKHKTRYLLENIDTLKELREKQKGIYVEKKKNDLIGYYVLYFKAHKMENNEIRYLKMQGEFTTPLTAEILDDVKERVTNYVSGKLKAEVSFVTRAEYDENTKEVIHTEDEIEEER